ncbi:MAG: hypothetical protein WBC44_09985 [Planctomycetaceae bacterium]
MNKIARACFTLTAIAPAFGAAAIVAFTQHNAPLWGYCLIIAGLGSAIASWGLVAVVRARMPRRIFKVTEIDQVDDRVLEFLLAYLLPVFSGTSLTDMTGSVLLTAYSLVFVAAVIAASNVFQFNPVLALCGYHFYVVKSDAGMSYLLISKSDFHKAEREITYADVTGYIRLEVPR